MKVCAYIMTNDTGLAPNPFHDVCTLAVCTPNHVRANVNSGDYIVGIAGATLCKKFRPPVNIHEPRIIYIMKVDKCMGLNDYYNTNEYFKKIPTLNGSSIDMCGDNFYKLINGELSHTNETVNHNWHEVMAQDCKGNRVFIGKTFWYFGAHAPEIPSKCNWGIKLAAQLKVRQRNITYIFGGTCNNKWDDVDLNEFLKFLSNLKNNHSLTPVEFSDCLENQPVNDVYSNYDIIPHTPIETKRKGGCS